MTELNLLRGIQNIGGGLFITNQSNGNSMIIAPLDDGMGAILFQNVKVIWQNL